jgi:ABC-2 type transport system permease protein
VFILFSHVGFSSSDIWLPLILLEIYLFALGLSFFLSTAFVKFRDVSYIWEVCLQAGFYLTPVLYPLTRITNLTFRKILLLNPMAQSLQDARYSIITHKAITIQQVFNNGPYQYIPLVIVLLVLIIGISFFRKQSKYFAENI